MLTASRRTVGTVGTAPSTTTMMVKGYPGTQLASLGAQCPPAVLPINIAPDQSGGAPFVQSQRDTGTWSVYGSEVEMKGLSGAPFGLGWGTFAGMLVGGLALGLAIAHLHK